MSIGMRFGPEQDARHPGQLLYPGTADGMPVLLDGESDVGGVGVLKREDFERIEHRIFYRARFFNMWDEREAEHYAWVMVRVVNGWFRVYDRQRVWDAKKQHFRVWLEWGQVYGTLPTRQHMGGL